MLTRAARRCSRGRAPGRIADAVEGEDEGAAAVCTSEALVAARLAQPPATLLTRASAQARVRCAVFARAGPLAQGRPSVCTGHRLHLRRCRGRPDSEPLHALPWYRRPVLPGRRSGLVPALRRRGERFAAEHELVHVQVAGGESGL